MKDIKYYCTPETVGELCGMFLVEFTLNGGVFCVNFLQSIISPTLVYERGGWESPFLWASLPYPVEQHCGAASRRLGFVGEF